MTTIGKCLTEQAIAGLLDGERTIVDSEVPSLCLRIRNNGSRTFVFSMNKSGKRWRITLGAVGELSLADARAKARIMTERVLIGEIPSQPRLAPVTFKEAADRWISEHAKIHLRTWHRMQATLGEKYCGALHNIPIDKIERRHIREVTTPLAAGTPIMANAIRATISAMMTWCVGQDIISINPCKNMPMPSPKTERTRFLTHDELRVFWRATGRLPYPGGPLFRLLALTGVRRSEAAGMMWREVNLAEKMWTLPPERTKNAKTHDVPLSDAAVAIIAAAPHRGPSVFGGHITALSVAQMYLYSAKSFIDGAMPPDTPRWTPHDLRRTFTTWCAKEGVQLHILQKCINHIPKGISGVEAIYNRYSYMDERRAAFAAWANYLQSFDSQSADIIPLRIVS